MKINVTRSSLPPFEEYCKEISSLWETRWLTNHGEKYSTLCEMIKDYLGCDNVVLYSNGHAALENAIAIYNFPKGSEIITTPFTFVSTANAIVRNGLIPRFCDIKEDDYTIDPKKIEKLINNRTVAILGVHVYGNVCDVLAIKNIARKYNLKVIYDAAHAFGVRYNKTSVSNYGDITMFSFHATKVFNTIEGGALTFADRSLEAELNCMKNFGLNNVGDCIYFGPNAKMNEFQAAMGICNIKYLDSNIKKREKIVKHYIKRLSAVDRITICSNQKCVSSNYSYFPVIFDTKSSRDKIKSKLEKNGIFTRKYFYPAVNEMDIYRKKFYDPTPIAHRISECVLTLPLFPDLSIEDVDNICDIIIKEYGK